ncbi:MAG TPA: amidase [Ignavibacteriaceae bacterium]|nr:amidase [Ignavibacteriaceae bacterium]
MKKLSTKMFPFIIVALSSFLLGAFIIYETADKPVTKEVITNAEKIFGISYSEAQQDSMLDLLNQRLESYQSIRKIDLDNSIPPAILFNPIPEGVQFSTKQLPFRISNYSSVKIPRNINDLAFYSVGELGYLLKTRKISSVQLTKFFIDRLKKYGPGLHCVITFTDDLAMKQAKKADDEIAAGKYKSPLMGIPFGVKDLLAVKGYKTTWGAAPYKDQTIDVNATVVKKLEAAGAVLIAKLSMGELAMDDVWFGGLTRNPWDTTQGSSGSSAGSAAAVSAGLVPFAIGTETWGSIVSPSTRCGDTGLRPTYGRVSRHGAMALSWSMDKIGPICRNVEDCAIVFKAIYGPDGIDQTVYNYPFNYTPKINLKGMRIGYLTDDFNHKYEFKSTDSLTIVEMRKLGAKLIPIKLPNLPVNDISFILDAEAGAAFDVLTRSGKVDLLARQGKDNWPNIFRASRFIPAVEYINANRVRYLLIQEMEKMFDENKIDLYLAPSDEGDNSLVTNLTGHPLVVVPNGFINNNHPTSITFVGRLFDEGKILEVAKAYQDATGYQLKHPPMFR